MEKLIMNHYNNAVDSIVKKGVFNYEENLRVLKAAKFSITGRIWKAKKSGYFTKEEIKSLVKARNEGFDKALVGLEKEVKEVIFTF